MGHACRVRLTIRAITVGIPAQVFAARAGLLASARSSLPCGQYVLGWVLWYSHVWLTLCLQEPPILRGSSSGDVFGEDKSSAAKARAANAMME